MGTDYCIVCYTCDGYLWVGKSTYYERCDSIHISYIFSNHQDHQISFIKEEYVYKDLFENIEYTKDFKEWNEREKEIQEIIQATENNLEINFGENRREMLIEMMNETEEMTVTREITLQCGNFTISQSPWNVDKYWFSRTNGASATEVDKDVLDAELEDLFMRFM